MVQKQKDKSAMSDDKKSSKKLMNREF